MLRVVTGRFHPDLELALVEEIRQLKTADPLSPLAIVVPSSLLVSRLREMLVLDQGLALLNLYVLTFHQFALRLVEKWAPPPRPGSSGERIEVVRDLFFEHLLGQIAKRNPPGCAALRLADLPPGAWAALWATLSDLRDASLDPAVVLKAVAEGMFDREDTPALQGLFTLDAAVREAGHALGVGTMDDVAALAVSRVPESGFLSRLCRVCYYGFYDLTQVQLSLLEAAAKHAPATVYFPLVDLPAFEFARRFYERHISRMAASPPEAARAGSTVLDEGIGSAKMRPRTMSAVGPDDELALVCKEILTLVETNGYRFDDIGVTARTLEPYRASLRRLFDQHRIPFTSTACWSLLRDPTAKAVHQLSRLPLNGLYRASVMDVLASPRYRFDPELTRGLDPRPDLWNLAVRALGITRGEEEWHRLSATAAVEARTGHGGDGDWEAGSVTIEAAQMRLLWNVVERLIRECRSLPAQGGFAELTDAFEALIESHFHVPGLTAAGPASAQEDTGQEGVGAAIRDVLEELRRLELVGGVVTWEDWAATWTRALERATVPITTGDHLGVRVLDAMSARGLPFRALFVLGLNEKVFPRFIHEDAFLRDRQRRVLDATLGYKIDEKLLGYDEEVLLFHLLLQAARERLYLFYQRADAAGRPLAASPYLAEFLTTGAGAEDAVDVRLPRRFSDRLAMPQFRPALLTNEELSLRLALCDADPTAVLAAGGRGPELFRNGWAALRQVEGESDGLGPFHGETGTLEDYWQRLMARGLAPTPLEQYARCPFQYFAAQVLRLESIREPVGGDPAAADVGRLCHSVLRAASERLIEAGWPRVNHSRESVRREVISAAEAVFAEHAAAHGTGYVLTWRLVQDRVTELAAVALEQDQEVYRQNSFEPVGFEVEAQGSLEGIGPKPLGLLKVHGRLDRVDRRASPPAVRIVDFKYRVSAEIEDKDKNLLTAAVRGFRLQPPLYVLMQLPPDGNGGGALPERVEFVYLAPHWDPMVQRSGFDAAEWQGRAANQLRHTFTLLLNGVREGQFPILPDRYCNYCDFRTACRRHHGPTWWRAYRAQLVRQLRLVRKQKVTRE